MKILGMVGAGLMASLMAVLAGGVSAAACESGAGTAVPCPYNGGGAMTQAVTVVYEEVATELAAARVEGPELWVTTSDLTRATKFELKPQGVCRDELCFPLPKARREAFLREDHDGSDKGTRWFDLTAFARLVGQPFAREGVAAGGASSAPTGGTDARDARAGSVWYFGLRADQRLGGGASGSAAQQEVSLKAPDFSLPDMAGKNHSLAELRGKKILLVTWASW